MSGPHPWDHHATRGKTKHVNRLRRLRRSILLVRLQSLDGLFVELVVTSYQFGRGQSTSDTPDWDANWLMVRGKAWDGVESWSFHDPCMTTWEARALASWLRGLGDADPEVRLWLTEPNLTFAFVAASQGVTTLDVHFDAESRPPRCSNDDHEGFGHRVRLSVPQADLVAAVGEWDRELAAFPLR